MAEEKGLVAAIVAVPEATASTVYGMYDVFKSAGRDWSMLMGETPGPAKIQPFVVGADVAGFRAANGAWIKPDCSFDECPKPDVICVSDLMVMPGEDLAGRYDPVIAWMQQAYRGGATVSSACSGALLLAEAGLLDNCDATSHWGYCSAMSSRYPKVRMQPSRALVASGDGQRIITAGGGSSWYDLSLFLVARFLGQEEAMQLARVYLIDWHRHGQLPFAGLARSRQVNDSVIGACQEWIADNYVDGTPVAAMTAMSGLSERAFKRRFVRATGLSPIAYVQTLRLEEAKQVLETTNMPVEAVAQEVGYEDGSFFRRLFRRKVGLTPGAYRRRFATVRRALQEAEDAGPAARLASLSPVPASHCQRVGLGL